MKRLPLPRARGYILLVVLIASAIAMTVTSAFFGYYASAVRAERQALAEAQALALAEAGIDAAVYGLNQDGNYSGESGTALGNGEFSVSVASIDGNTKRVTATGFVPNSANPTALKTVQATVGINTSIVAFRYGVQIGEGGVTMGNGAQIIGNIFSNGNITGGGTVTGDATVAIGSDATANQQMETQNASFNLGDVSARANVAQSFKPSVSAELVKIRLYMKKTGSPGDITIKIVADNNGKPSTTVLASGTIPASLITGSYGFADSTLDGTPLLVAEESYWIIAIASVSASDYFIWGRDSSGGYARGAAKYSSNWNAQNPSWSAITGDLGFEAYLSGAHTKIEGVTVGGDAWAYTLVDCTVAGDASYQTMSNCGIGGVQNAGAAITAPAPFPISEAQIADWEAIAEAGGTIPGPYTHSGPETLGPKKIDGDLTIPINDALTLSGPVWVNGDITFGNGTTFSVSPGTGASGAILIADATGATATRGIIDLSNNVTISGNGGTNSFPMAISTNTGTNAIKLANNAQSAILYAPYGTVEVKNGGGANQITAYHLVLENNATITYVSGLQNASFSNGPGGSWAFIPGTYAITN